MDFFGFEKALNFLLAKGLDISELITDRHSTNAKFMREKHKDIKHYFDLWHIKKSE